jgi:phosphoribosyl 1,2-cyclic phosphate phosphodiesterase
MSQPITLTILGSGTSHGIPMIGCRCPVCTSDDPRNRRHRASVLVQFAGRNVLVDTTPELRLQAVRAGLDRVDAVLMTHQHSDHVAGFDDLRRFGSLQKSPLEVYAHADTVRRLREMFPYVAEQAIPEHYEIPAVHYHTVTGPFDLFGLTVTPVPLIHGRWSCYGYRFGRLAYCTDVRDVPPESRDLLRGLDTLVLGALRHRPHATHFTVAEALEVVADVKPRRTYLTHIAHDLDHAATNAALPPGVELAWDGLVVSSEW